MTHNRGNIYEYESIMANHISHLFLRLNTVAETM